MKIKKVAGWGVASYRVREYENFIFLCGSTLDLDAAKAIFAVSDCYVTDTLADARRVADELSVRTGKRVNSAMEEQ